MVSVIEIDGLTRDYGRGRGIFDLTFSVEEGEAFGFLGPNGAGKTTTIRHLMGFLRPRAGRCTIGGRDCWSSAADIQRSLGYLPGEVALPGDMTGTGYLRFLAAYRGVRGTGRAKELMERFELDPSGPLRRMSKGMKQKVGLVAALFHDPAVLILDEPTSGLDPLMQSRFVELILEERARGKTVLMSSHSFDEVERTCRRVAILRAGRLAAVDGVDALTRSRRKTYTVTLADEAETERFLHAGLEVTGRSGCRVTVTVQDDLPRLLAALAAHRVTGLDQVQQSLEEVFLHYYGGDGR